MVRAADSTPAEMAERDRWLATTMPFAASPALPARASLTVVQNHGLVLRNSWCGEPFRVGGRVYYDGLFCHAPSEVRAKLLKPARSFRAEAGVQTNFMTSGGRGSVRFAVSAGGAELFRSDVMREGQAPVSVDVPLSGATEIVLSVDDGGDGISCDQADWAEARVELEDGTVIKLGDLPIVEGQEGPAFPTDLPFSLVYGGRSSREFLPAWGHPGREGIVFASQFIYDPTWRDPETGLELRCKITVYRGYPIVEWTCTLTNRGTADTPLIENVQAIDTSFSRYPVDGSGLGEFVLHHNRGDDLKVTNYEPLTTKLPPNEHLHLAATGGRPTQFVFPYFDLEWLGEGVILALGWPGQWACDFERDGDVGVRVVGGQEATHFVLHPGEQVRMPRVVMQFWRGDWVHAQNVWRDWMRTYNMPRPGGDDLGPQWNANMRGETLENSGGAEQIKYIDGFIREDLHIDYWWMDAGWYQGSHEHGWPFTGTWEVDTERFPGGFRPISDHAHELGIKTLVWFEPERVVPGTWLYETHPEWLLGPDGQQKLLNLGNPDARAWVTDYMSTFLEREGIDLYRQDFNVDPLGYWQLGDAPDRQGITENHYVTGYLAFWDELLRRKPGLVIDSCASGGRRNDVETMRRAVPKHRSDLIFEPVSQQCMTYALSSWFPFFGSGTLSMDPYEFWSDAAPSNTTAWDVARADLPYDQLRAMAKEWHEVAGPMIRGDFYPLTPYSTDEAAWIAWQYDAGQYGGGVVQAFRRADSVYEVARLRLRGLDPEARYLVRDIHTGGQHAATGDELMQIGPRVEIRARPGVVNLYYKQL